jgi:hypothetical protein
MSAPIRSRRDAGVCHPFGQGALFAKDEIRGFLRVSSEERARLANAMWAGRARGGSSVERTTKFDAARHKPAAARKTAFVAPTARSPRLTFDQLPEEVRRIVYQYCCMKAEQSPPVPESPATPITPAALRLESGLPALCEAFPALATEILETISTSFSPTVFAFDLRKSDNGFLQWTKSHQREARLARTLRLKHWTCWTSATEPKWMNADDTTTFEIEPSGVIKITRSRTARVSACCRCDMNDLIGRRCPGSIVNKTWSLKDFSQALRTDDPLLIQAAVEFICLFNQPAIANDSPDCDGCGLRRIHFRTHKEEGQINTALPIKNVSPRIQAVPSFCAEYSPVSTSSASSAHSSGSTYYSTRSECSPSTEYSPCSDIGVPKVASWQTAPKSMPLESQQRAARPLPPLPVEAIEVEELPSEHIRSDLAPSNLKRSSAVRRPDTLPRSSTAPASFTPQLCVPAAYEDFKLRSSHSLIKPRTTSFELDISESRPAGAKARPQSYIAPKASYYGRPDITTEGRVSPSSVRAAYTQTRPYIPSAPPAASQRPNLRLITPYVQSFSDFKRIQDQWRAAEQREASTY